MNNCPVCHHHECENAGSLRCLRLHLSPPEIHTPLNYSLGIVVTILWLFSILSL